MDKKTYYFVKDTPTGPAICAEVGTIDPHDSCLIKFSSLANLWDGMLNIVHIDDERLFDNKSGAMAHFEKNMLALHAHYTSRANHFMMNLKKLKEMKI